MEGSDQMHTHTHKPKINGKKEVDRAEKERGVHEIQLFSSMCYKKKKRRRNQLESTHLLTSLFIPGDYQDTIICLLEIKNMNK